MKHLTAVVFLTLTINTDVAAQQARHAPPSLQPAQRRVSDQDRFIHAQREVATTADVIRLVRGFADAIQAPDHIRWFCLAERTNRMNELRRSEPDHPFFMHSNTGFFANEAGELVLRTRRSYEISLQQICLANAMRAIRDFPPIDVPLVAPIDVLPVPRP